LKANIGNHDGGDQNLYVHSDAVWSPSLFDIRNVRECH